jgi:hypothetical protein
MANDYIEYLSANVLNDGQTASQATMMHQRLCTNIRATGQLPDLEPSPSSPRQSRQTDALRLSSYPKQEAAELITCHILGHRNPNSLAPTV